MSRVSTTTYVNRYGRRQSRGWRPWALLPKVICIGFYLGGLGALCVVWFTSGFDRLDKADPQRIMILDQVRAIVLWLVVPALSAAIVLGVVLFTQHPRQFVRMRWMQVKLASVAVLVPAAHLFLASRSYLMRDAFEQGTVNTTAEGQFGTGLVVVLVGSIWVVILGRLKPRLGQNYAKAFAASVGEPRSRDGATTDAKGAEI